MEEPVVTVDDLPMSFVVKYLGWEPARGLYGIKFTRKPVDNLVAKARNLPENHILPRLIVEVTKEGLSCREISKRLLSPESVTYGVNEISYGVQDIIYTRVFSIIIVTDKKLEEGFTFVCHSFVCENKHQARQLTYALAAAFTDYAQKMKDSGKLTKQKKFAIDLRTPEQQAAGTSGEGEDEETEA